MVALTHSLRLPKSTKLKICFPHSSPSDSKKKEILRYTETQRQVSQSRLSRGVLSWVNMSDPVTLIAVKMNVCSKYPRQQLGFISQNVRSFVPKNFRGFLPQPLWNIHFCFFGFVFCSFFSAFILLGLFSSYGVCLSQSKANGKSCFGSWCFQLFLDNSLRFNLVALTEQSLFPKRPKSLNLWREVFRLEEMVVPRARQCLQARKRRL